MGERRRGRTRQDEKGNAYFRDLTYFQETIYVEKAPYLVNYTGSRFLALDDDNRVIATTGSFSASATFDTGSFLISGSIAGTTLYFYDSLQTYSLELPAGSGGSGSLSSSADTGSYILDLANNSLNILGGKNIHTFASSSKETFIILDHHIEVHSIAVTQSASEADIINVRSLDGREPLKVNSSGVLVIGPTSSLPVSVTTGSIVYISGSNDENLYIGFNW